MREGEFGYFRGPIEFAFFILFHQTGGLLGSSRGSLGVCGGPEFGELAKRPNWRKEKMVIRQDITKAVRQVRKHFGETQPQFAQRMKTAVVTIARWETSRPPRGESLEDFLALAKSENLADCVEVFREALSGHIEPAPSSPVLERIVSALERIADQLERAEAYRVTKTGKKKHGIRVFAVASAINGRAAEPGTRGV